MSSIVLVAALFGSPPAIACPPPAPCVCVCQGGAPESVVTAAPPCPRADLPPAAQAPAAPPLAPQTPSSPAPAARAEPSFDRSHWYGGAAVATDTIAAAMIVGGGASNDPSLATLGAIGYVLGAPMSYLVLRHPRHALGSLGIRALASGLAAGAVLFDVLGHPCDGERSCQHTPTTGLTVGALTLLAAAIVDDAVLAREPVSAPSPRATFTPSVVLSPSLAFVSMRGSF
jgi:hypothetical protein